MLYDLSGIWDLKKLFSIFFSFFLFHECPSDINYKTEKKGRVAAGKSWSELMIVVQFKANGLC